MAGSVVCQGGGGAALAVPGGDGGVGEHEAVLDRAWAGEGGAGWLGEGSGMGVTGAVFSGGEAGRDKGGG